jgi:hypothetical protein
MGKNNISNLRLVWRIVLVISLFLPLYSETQEIQIKKENGITVVYNPKNPVQISDVEKRLFLTGDLVIGKEVDKKDYWFSLLFDIAVDDSGNIYTLDPKDIRIRV